VVRHMLLAGAVVVTGMMAPLAAASPRAPSAPSAASPHGPSAVAPAVPGRPRAGLAAGNPVCKGLARGLRHQPGGFMASSGALAFCLGPQPNGPARARRAPVRPVKRAAPANVNAASIAEDVAPGGPRGFGQSETSVAAAGPYVAQAWNDATAFFAACPSPRFKEEFTGLGFSADGGRSFTDLGGLPNTGCRAGIYEGDPSVTAYQAGGHTYFYVTSMFDSPAGTGRSFIKLAACAAAGGGSRASLRCGQPVTVAVSTVCTKVSGFAECDFLDKDFAAIDPARGRLYVAYTRFNVAAAISGHGDANDIELSACDLGTKAGRPGPAGGTPAAPVCTDGAAGRPGPFTVARGDSSGCELEGAYPAVDTATGAVYAGYESNWFTNGATEGPLAPCGSKPTTNVIAKMPGRCLTLSGPSPCRGPAATRAVRVVSMDSAAIPGYNRDDPNDFPRVAVSGPAGTVSMVWNDAADHPLGDILLQSFALGSLARVQRHPAELSARSAGLNFLPAVRTASASGRLDVTWFTRASPATTLTSVVAVLGLDPRRTATPPGDVTITSVPSDWLNADSVIVPNFGDYTDNAVTATGAAPYVGRTLYVAWSDGRLGVPQPFAAHLPAG
jgi:hypothetical protein